MNTILLRNKLSYFLRATLCSLFTFACWAESLPPNESDNTPNQSADKTEIVVVSGSRQAEGLVSTPLNISLINHEQIKEKSAQHPSEILSSLSGVWVSRGDGQEHLTAIRSPVFSGSGACANFFIAEDGIPVRASGFCNVNQLFDTHYEVASKVELFRGPNSSVFGSNALFGGIVFFSPSLQRQNDVSLSAASYDDYRLHWKLANQHHGVFAALTHDQGYRDDTSVQQQKFTYKSQLKIGDWSSTNTLQLNNLEQNTAGFIEGEDAYKNRALVKTNSNPEAYRNAHSVRFASHNTLQIDKKNSLRISPYARHHDMEFLMHFVPWQPVEENSHQSLGLQSLWTHQYSDALSMYSGLDAEFTKAKLIETQLAPAPFNQANFPQGEHYNYQVKATNYSLFNHLRFDMTRNLSFSSNVRRDFIAYDYINNLTDGYACEPNAGACRFYRPEDRSDTFAFSSYRASLLYKLNQETSIYGTRSRAFRAAQAAELYSAQSASSATLKEVELNGMEMGIKGNHRPVSWQLALYHMAQSNGIYQNSERIYLTGAETSHRGLEYEFEYRALGNLHISLAGSFAKHSYDNSPNTLGVTQNIQGNEMDTAPRKMNTLAVRWFPSTDTRVGASLHRMGRYFLDPENDFDYEGHYLLDLSAEYFFNRNLSVDFHIKNAADARYAERADVAFGDPRYFPGLPRRFLISLTYRQ